MSNLNYVNGIKDLFFNDNKPISDKANDFLAKIDLDIINYNNTTPNGPWSYSIVKTDNSVGIGSTFNIPANNFGDVFIDNEFFKNTMFNISILIGKINTTQTKDISEIKPIADVLFNNHETILFSIVSKLVNIDNFLKIVNFKEFQLENFTLKEMYVDGYGNPVGQNENPLTTGVKMSVVIFSDILGLDIQIEIKNVIDLYYNS